MVLPNINDEFLKLAGDEAFVELIQEKQLKLTKIAYRYCMNETMAQDALSETIYKAYRYRKKCKQPEYFDTWITRILINECYNEQRRQKRFGRSEAL